MSTTTPSRTDAELAREAWQSWRAERDSGLAAPYDWVAVVGYHWVTAATEASAIAVPDVPGRWWVADGVLHVTAGAEDALFRATDQATLIDGFETAEVPEAGSQRFATIGAPLSETDDGPVLIEVVRRGGYYALRLRDPQAPARAAFSGVPAFDHNPSWVIDVELHPYEEPQQVRVGAAAPGLEQVATAIGEVTFERDGRRHRLVAIGRGEQWYLSFSDATSGVLTSAWRIVPIEGEVADGVGTVDLNRAMNFPYVFTDFGTCPRPIAGNHLDLEVTAGERAPTGRTGVPPTEGGPTALPGKQLLP